MARDWENGTAEKRAILWQRYAPIRFFSESGSIAGTWWYPLKCGSPDWSKGRTFRVVFRFRQAAARPRTATRKPAKVYRNPIFLAREWQQALDKNKVSSRAELARKLGVSRARVTQVLRLLELSPKVLCMVRALGDPLDYLIMTERQLRPVVRCKFRDQKRLIKELLPQTRHFRPS